MTLILNLHSSLPALLSPVDSSLDRSGVECFHLQTLECLLPACGETQQTNYSKFSPHQQNFKAVCILQILLCAVIGLHKQRVSGKKEAHLTALMCSQLAIPVMAPFCSLVLPCTVNSCKKINKEHLKPEKKLHLRNIYCK